ncbi:hypothetical protein GCM10023189_37590 [Nibrella saemangeumensis]|uniref:Uncharacterized protein n=1 Tax=Nibrella saemangeumensis TaxID=1084526 RepID=A0ABP8N981_9BACT
MKTLLTLLLMSAGLAAVAQRSSLHQEINDDGKSLRIRVDAEQKGRAEVHYQRTFDVKGMSKEEKEALVSRVIDSLGIMETRHDVVIIKKHRENRDTDSGSRTAAKASSKDKEDKDSDCDETKSVTKVKTARSTTTVNDGTVASSSSGVGGITNKPFTKTIEEDPGSGRLKMHYEYTKDGEQFIFERTVNAQGKTEKEKQRLIEETEKSLGLPVKNM